MEDEVDEEVDSDEEEVEEAEVAAAEDDDDIEEEEEEEEEDPADDACESKFWSSAFGSKAKQSLGFPSLQSASKA